jgi:GNAT superfamily N-acetyltransferase
MITSDTTGLDIFCGRDVFGTRIAAYYKAYKDIGGARFFVQRNASGEVTAAISDVGGAVTLCCSEGSGFDELSSVLKFCGAKSVMCGGEYGDKLKLIKTGYGSIVEAPAGIVAGANVVYVTSASEAFSFKGVYDTLNACGFITGGYPGWLADISLRIRRGTAEMLIITDGDTVAATASALFVTEEAVLLGAVGTMPEYRGRGYAGALVRALASEHTSSGRRTELLCEPHRLSFYTSLGFCETGKWFAGTVS